ncbi:helix-turn-helix domain-containing protein [Winogradskya humida]|uniref:AraC family transcriptional regulator n=1 Tax=Winogradskya humida TaxID=113566 RepID=A0ABQ3ZU03_9ACTN|nr:AraC family transcriptional regulator [Actinoplanes humidus]GIE22054.1 AraC family transcriptional regulator [Actinoplanes humidus]
MVKKRQDAIPEIGFAPPAGSPAGVEVMTLGELHARGHATLGEAHRPAFHHLLTPSRGTLWHTVDFTGYAVTPGTWLWVRPGQVQQWGDLRGADGTLILFEADFLDSATAAQARLNDPHAPVLYDAGDDGGLAGTFAQSWPVGVREAILRHLLCALVLRLSHGTAHPERTDVFTRFQQAVERDFARTRRLEDYARRLGYSTRTVSRATQAAAGLNAKDFIDRRVVLEARRLLAHSDHTAAQVAARLGFTSATNFSKYFHQRTGATPLGFRAIMRPTLHKGAAWNPPPSPSSARDRPA